MPEESFEQQARNMAEQFSMEPQPIVWQRVKAAISPKRRRRAASVWWLLPLCIACGLAFWLINDSKLMQKKEGITKQNITAKTKIQPTEKRDKIRKNTDNKLPTHPTIAKEQNIASIDKEDTHSFVKSKQSGNEKMSTKQKNDAIPFQPQTHFAIDTNAVKEKDVKTESANTLIQSQTDVLANGNTVTDFKKMDLQKPKATVSDSAKTNTEIAIKTNDTLKQNKDSSLAVINKKKGKNKWHWGVTVEGGTNWLGNGLFGDQAKSLSDFSIVPTGMTNGGSQNASTYQKQRKNGVDAALGIAVETNLSKHWFLDGAFTYRYQQFLVQTTSFSSLSAPLNGNVIKSNANYSFRSANFYTGIGLPLFHKKNTSVAVQAGMDNGWLLSVKQMNNDTLQRLTAQGFQRWQPSLQFAIPVGIYSKENTHWQLSPFVRWGLRGLQKGGDLFAHHPLNAAGVKAIYFFK